MHTVRGRAESTLCHGSCHERLARPQAWLFQSETPPIDQALARDPERWNVDPDWRRIQHSPRRCSSTDGPKQLMPRNPRVPPNFFNSVYPRLPRRPPVKHIHHPRPRHPPERETHGSDRHLFRTAQAVVTLGSSRSSRNDTAARASPQQSL